MIYPVSRKATQNRPKIPLEIRGIFECGKYLTFLCSNVLLNMEGIMTGTFALFAGTGAVLAGLVLGIVAVLTATPGEDLGGPMATAFVVVAICSILVFLSPKIRGSHSATHEVHRR